MPTPIHTVARVDGSEGEVGSSVDNDGATGYVAIWIAHKIGFLSRMPRSNLNPKLGHCCYWQPKIIGEIMIAIVAFIVVILKLH